MSRRRNLTTALVVATALLAPVAFTSGPASAHLRHWHYSRIAQRGDVGPRRVRLGGGYVGHVKFLDNLVAISQRFRNAKGKPRKRLYRISGALSIRLKPGYSIFDAVCHQKVQGAQIVPLRNGTRAFFPQEANPSPRTEGGVNVGLNLGPFSVSVPVPGLAVYSGSDAPAVGWPVPNRSSVQRWGWIWIDPRHQPNDELLPFLGHWVKGAKGVHYKVVCHVNVSGYGASGGAKIRMTRHVRT